eukprot:scaffold170769_cov28-Tisochrysis_lutea.AAC.12
MSTRRPRVQPRLRQHRYRPYTRCYRQPTRHLQCSPGQQWLPSQDSRAIAPRVRPPTLSPWYHRLAHGQSWRRRVAGLGYLVLLPRAPMREQ